ncbi:fimbria/pilus periplasmic chaperone [Pseudomonas sp. Wu6]|uniref:Fimbrial chaperone protein n=1 Tax=Pseudomonas orientalis TaxID=76758 RepID=A0A4Q7CXT0_9PSED|nr:MULTISPECIES: fimbria/pilus chaperone family protein [Pseudomonas]MBY8931473.1 fimbria/pilus periplasmic chaperone [Pseudomonas sp. Wu6]RZI31244.1 fimbrial chaperone protein [Pseudomonas orientalis]
MRLLFAMLMLCVVGVVGVAVADGMLPETTVIVLNEEQGEATINIKNTDAAPALLHSVIENVPEDMEPLLIVTPPIARVEAGETQLVRFISTLKAPLKTQRLKRVTFEGIPQARAAGGATIGITLRQNLPLILHPQGLPVHHTPWELLKWRSTGQRLSVHNDSAYVVRMAPQVRLLPQGTLATLPRTYILPGEALAVKVEGPLQGLTGIEIQPATIYGFSVENYRAPITADGG